MPTCMFAPTGLGPVLICPTIRWGRLFIPYAATLPSEAWHNIFLEWVVAWYVTEVQSVCQFSSLPAVSYCDQLVSAPYHYGDVISVWDTSPVALHLESLNTAS